MNNPQITARQHFVPRMYLKRWVHDDKELLFVISKYFSDTEVHEVTYDDKLFYKIFCYDIFMPNNELYTNNEVERKFAEYENRHDRLLNRMISRMDNKQPVLDKGTNRLENFLEFVSLTVLRNPQNVIPLKFDNISTSTEELSNLFFEMFGDEWNLTGLQIAANSMNRDLLFQALDQLSEGNPDCYFLESTNNTRFITSNNPVLCSEKWSFIALSPRYACFLLFDTRINCRFTKNKKYALNDSEVIEFNKLFWKQKDNDTIIGMEPDDLLKAL